MYRCKECGEEYKIKPEYCECGNDKFEELFDKKNHIKRESFIKRYNISPYTIVFFIICIILSILILLFFANPDTSNDEILTEKILQKNEQVKIPDIETFWNNTPIKQESISEPVVEIIQIIEKPFSQQNKSIQQTKQKPVKTTQTKTVKTQQTATTHTQKSSSKTQINNQEVYNYKLQLRNALFTHLNVAGIQGSGKCGIEFSVNTNGKLINRAFTFQSDNKTLNDEVYKMLMKMPVYNPPPSSYSGELIKITFSFNNGTYEVRLEN